MSDRNDEPTAITPGLAELIREVDKVFHPEEGSKKPAQLERKMPASKAELQTKLTFSGLDMISAERRRDYAGWMKAADRLCGIVGPDNKDVREYKAAVLKYGRAQARKVHDQSVICINHLIAEIGKKLAY